MRMFLVVAGVVLVGCGAGSPPFSGGAGTGGGLGAGSTGGAGGTGTGGGSGGVPSAGTGGGAGSGTPDAGTKPESGVLTAGAWDDNLNFDFYLAYLRSKGTLPGAPVFERADRLVVLAVDQDGHPLPGARVALTHGGATKATTVTGADGRALFFPKALGLMQGDAVGVTVHAGVITAPVATAQALAGDKELTVTAAAFTAQAITAVEIAIVLDTTGSMGDEINWLKSELAAISSSVTAQFPSLTQRFALITYKDRGDAYVTKKRDFGTLTAFKTALASEHAEGGGDWPEALPEALADLTTLSWSGGATARLAFHIADAPHHAGKEGEVVASLTTLRGLGVHVYPVAASGVSDITELVMRTEAQLTGGRYLFLTDDSGVGNSHQEPTLPCYVVTKLDKAMLRMIQMEITGAHVDVAPADVIRTGGNPQDGRCTLAGGGTVLAL